MRRTRLDGRVAIKTRFALRKPLLLGLLRPSAFQKPAWISPPEWKSMELVPANAVPRVTPDRLANLLDFYGSNKASKHDYQFPLSFAFNVAPAGALVEFGIAASSTHGPEDGPIGPDEYIGASLRAAADLGRFTNVIGADHDPRFLIRSEHFTSIRVDQYDIESLRVCMQQADAMSPSGIAVVIDDGAHTHDSILNTVVVAFPHLKKGGVMIVEDLDRSTLQTVLSEVLRVANPCKWGLWSNLDQGPNNNVLVIGKID